MLLDAETDADAASLLVPVAVGDDKEKVMNKNWLELLRHVQSRVQSWY